MPAFYGHSHEQGQFPLILEDPRAERRKTILKIILLSVGVCVAVTLLAVVSFYKLVLYNTPAIDVENLPMDKKLLITIPRGASLSEISNILQESGVIESASLFKIAARYLRSERSLKAGQYLLPAHCSNHQLVRILQNAIPQSVRITIPEGKNTTYLIAALQSKLPLDSAKFSRLIMDTALCHAFHIQGNSLFGYLMPNTYFIDPGTSERDVIRLMVAEYSAFFDEELQKRADQLHLSPHQVQTLASIIEGETSDDDERYLVSAVYHNRLKRNLLLQADPTIQFIITDGPRRLFNRDLEIDNVYNTYKYAGLPPGPVNNPGKASILAALYPASTNFMYMVADGKGKHIFSKTMQEHLQAKKQLDKIRKEFSKQKK